MLGTEGAVVAVVVLEGTTEVEVFGVVAGMLDTGGNAS